MFNEDSMFNRRENAIDKDASLKEIQQANQSYFEQIKKSQ